MLDRTGEPVDTDARILNHPIHDPRCHDGWLGEDSEGHPKPCLHCRPHLKRTKDVSDHGVYR
jgi:hypothetical protein